MKVGDLVVLKNFCRARRRPALVLFDGPPGMVKIVFVDTGTSVPALKENLELVSESR